MHTISNGFRAHHTTEGHAVSRGLGIATVLLGLTAAALSTHRVPADQAFAGWSPTPSAAPATFESSVPLEIFPLGMMAAEASR